MRSSRAMLLALVALLGPALADAASVIAVLSADHGVYRRAYDGFAAAFGQGVPMRLASGDGSLDADTRVVLAVGGRAARRSYPPGVSVVYLLTPPIEVDSGRPESTHVRAVPRPQDLLARIKSVQPKARTLAVLWSQAAYRGYVSELVAQGDQSGIKVLSLPSDSSDLPRALHLAEGRADALWLAPDPLLVTPANFRMIGKFADGAKIVFYAPTADLVQEGATAAVAVTPEEMGRSAADIVRGLLAGHPEPPEVFGERVQVTVDGERAAAAGLVLPSDVVRTPRAPKR